MYPFLGRHLSVYAYMAPAVFGKISFKRVHSSTLFFYCQHYMPTFVTLSFTPGPIVEESVTLFKY